MVLQWLDLGPDLAELLVFQLQGQKTRWRKVILLLDLSKYTTTSVWTNMFSVCNFQTQTKRKHKMENVFECINVFFLSANFIVYKKYRRVSALFTVYTGWCHLSKPTGGSEESLTFQVVGGREHSRWTFNLVLENSNLQIQMECSIRTVAQWLAWWCC